MKIAIAGYGAEGESNYRYYNTPENQVVIVDERQPLRTVPVDASVIIGDQAFSRLNGYDMVVRTAGLAPRKIVTDGKVWSATNEFFTQCPAPIIGVTGSKGKGTISSLIAAILRAGAKTVHLVGNIGVPALDILSDIEPDDIVVYELSSFQLWDIQSSPSTAVINIIEPDHLDVHVDMNEYIESKSRIARYQRPGDSVFYAEGNDYAKRAAFMSNRKGHPRVVRDKDNTRAFPDESSVYVRDGYFYYYHPAERRTIRLCRTDELQLPGQHNIRNATGAIAAALGYLSNIESGDLGRIVAQGLRTFTGLPHRLKCVGSVSGVAYYDDSIATTPGSAIAALRAFDQPKVLILGGSYKGADFRELATAVAGSAIRHVILIGAEANRIEKDLAAAGVTALTNIGTEATMHEVVHAASELAESGDVVILSPACASFGMFKNYTDRGEQFIAAVDALAGRGY